MEHEQPDGYKTRLLTGDAQGVGEAAALLRAGELVGIPTETVYGLAANALDGAAVARIFEAKGRPQDNPLIVHIAAWEELAPLAQEVPPLAKTLADAFWPGPLTMIVSRSALVPDAVSAGLSTVAVRMPSHPLARAVIRETGLPLAAPSANRSGSPSPTTAAHVLRDLDRRIPAVLDGGECAVGVESTVVDVTGPVPRVLRPGGITPAMLAKAAGGVSIDPAVTHRLREGEVASSPGMKYKHYAPRARVVLVRGAPAAYAAYVNDRRGDGVVAMCFSGEEAALAVPALSYGRREDPQEQARRVFTVLRRLDDIDARTVYCACPDPAGVGLAVYNRLLRAAGFEVIDLDR